MLNIVLLDQEGECYGLAARLTQEGHIVKLWTSQPEQTEHDLLFEARRIDSSQAHLEAADLVVSNERAGGGIADSFRKGSRLALGGRIQGLLTEPGWQGQLADILKLEYTPEATNYHFGLSGWFNGQDWVGQFGVKYYLRLLDDDRGPMTKGMGCAAIAFEETMLEELTEFLREVDYRGFFTLRLVFKDGQLYIKEAIPYLSALELAACGEIVKQSDSGTLLRVAQGKQGLDLLHGMMGIAVRLAYFELEDAVLNEEPAAYKHFWPEVAHNTLGICSARGLSSGELRARVYRTTRSLASPGLVYRTDIGQGVEDLNVFKTSK